MSTYLSATPRPCLARPGVECIYPAHHTEEARAAAARAGVESLALLLSGLTPNDEDPAQPD